MITNIKKITVIMILAASVFLPCSYVQAIDAADSALKMMPVPNIQAELEINAPLVKAGPGAIAKVCDRIVPPGTGDDTAARYAISSLVTYTSRPGAAAEKKMLSAELTGALARSSDKEVKSFFITQLQFVGDDDSVPELSKYLGDKRLCEPASFTLQTIGTDSAKEAFLNALPNASKETLPTIIHALGQLRVKDAVKGITRHARSKDRTERLVSLDALAEIGDPSSVKIIAKALKVKDPYERGIVASNYVNLAKRLQETGRSKDAVKICKSILKSKDNAIKSSVKSSALGVIVDALGSKADDYIEDAFDDGDDQLQASALGLVVKLADPSVTKDWAKKLKKAPLDRKFKIIEMMGMLQDQKSLGYLHDAVNDRNNDVRIAAAKAVMARGEDARASAGTLLLGILRNSPNAAQTQTIKSLMLQLPTESFASTAIVLLPKTPANGQVALIEVLAERRVSSSLEAVFSLTSSKDSSVSVAATKALTDLAGPADIPRVIDLVLNTKSSAQRIAASRAVVQLCRQIEDGSVAAKPLLDAMKGATVDQQISIIKLFSSVGTKQALDIVVRETQSTNAKLSDAAIRTLTKWKNADALDALLNIASTTKQLNYNVITLKAYATLTEKSDIPATDKVVNFKKAIEAAKRPNEKSFVVSSLAQVKSLETLAMAVDLLDDKVLAGDAARAVVRIALPNSKGYKGLKGPGVGNLLLDAYTKIDDKEIRKKLDEYIKLLAKEQAAAGESVSQKKAPEGFVSLFNGKDLTGWKGLMARPNDNPAKRAKLKDQEYAAEQAKADELMRKHWHVVDGTLYFDGGGYSLATASDYGDFEMLVDWKLMHDNGDSGIYLRGSPQVQIWDPAHWKIGSGGLYNNKKNPSNPIVIADNPIGQWNTFRIKMIGEKVTVYLNDKLVVDNVTLENYWDRKKPIFPSGQIELQCHNNPVCFKNIFIRQIPRKDEFVSLFNGRDLAGWIGDTKGYIVEDGNIVCKPGGNLYTQGQYSDFVLRFKFKLTDSANNGLGIRTKVGVNAAYDGMELQILDNNGKKYKDKLKLYQYHGSIYGVVPAKRGFLKPTGQWNSEEVIAKGNQITVILNGETIVDADIKEASKNGTIDNRPHPGLFNKTGHIGFLGHGSVVEFKDIEIKELK